MSVTIPRLANIWEDPGPGWGPDQRADGEPCHPLIKCRCQRILHITAHTVHEDGTVWASFLHQFQAPAPQREIDASCGWHEFIVLDGWDGGHVDPRP